MFFRGRLLALACIAGCSFLGTVDAQDFSTTCVIKEGSFYAADPAKLSDLGKSTITQACSTITQPGNAFALVAGIKASTTSVTYQDTYAKYCRENTGGWGSSYCAYVYRAVWQATCCGKQLL